MERLLNSPEYASHWAGLWTDWLIGRDSPPLARAQLKLWLEEEIFARDASHKEMVERLLTATGKTNENGAVNFILAYLGRSASTGFEFFEGEGCGAVHREVFGTPDADVDAGPRARAARLARVGQFDMRPLTLQTTRLFLGHQITCCQCHNHPFNAEWAQKDFWGVNAFLRQVERVGDPRRPDAVLEIRDNPDFHTRPLLFFQKRNSVIVATEPRFLDGRRLPQGAGNRRKALADLVTSHPNFAPAAVNRLWAHFFGWGMNVREDADNFGEHNELVHPELLEELAKAFAGPARYRPRELIRWICASAPYQLKAEANATNSEDDRQVFLSRALEKGLRVDVLRESLLVAVLQDNRGAKAKQVRRLWEREVATTFDALDNDPPEPSVKQLLVLMTNPRWNAALAAPDGTLARARRQATARAALDVLFLATLTRPTSAEEYKQLARDLGLNDRKAPDAEVLEDVLWALLNCNEFAINH